MEITTEKRVKVVVIIVDKNIVQTTRIRIVRMVTKDNEN